MNLTRCDWHNFYANINQESLYYHDNEWGVPVYDDNKLFELLVLEGVQAGLNWSLVLSKRTNYQKAYGGFDPRVVANYNEDKKIELMTNKGLVRSQSKIESSINNAKCVVEIQKEHGSFSKYIWGMIDNQTIHNNWETMADIPCENDLSKHISNDMKKRGFKFFGPKICYSFMQAVGMVNDHTIDCFRHKYIKSL